MTKLLEGFIGHKYVADSETVETGKGRSNTLNIIVSRILNSK